MSAPEQKEIPEQKGQEFNVPAYILTNTSSLWVQKMQTFFRLYDAEGKGVFLLESSMAEKAARAKQLSLNNAEEIFSTGTGVMKSFYFAGCLSINKSGEVFIVWRDFIVFIYNHFIVKLGKTKFLEENKSQVQHIFLLYDTDQDGKLSRDEVAKFYEAMGISKQECRISFAALDKDNNGRVSFDEMAESYAGFFFDMEFTSNALMLGNLCPATFKAV